MANIQTYKTVFMLRRATTAEWEENKNIVPFPGEPCYDLDLGTLRIGNGKDTYEDLKVIGSGAELGDISAQVAEALNSLIDEDELQEILNLVLNN